MKRVGELPKGVHSALGSTGGAPADHVRTWVTTHIAGRVPETR